MPYYGYYSAAAARKFGHCIYTDENGLEIAVTEVCSTEGKPAGRWNDAIYVGEVFDCIKPNNINFDINPIELLKQCQEALAEENRCKKQFPTTGKCFCFVCPINNSN